MKISTCRTTDMGDGTPCPNNGLGFYWDDQAAQQAAEDAGATFSGTIYCGPCGQAITDVVDATEDPGVPPNNFIPPPEPEPAPTDGADTTV